MIDLLSLCVCERERDNKYMLRFVFAKKVYSKL